MKWTRERTFGLIAMGIGLCFALIIAEIVLRIVPNNFTPRNDPEYAEHDAVSYILKSNQNPTVVRACVTNEDFKVNALGFRGAEWQADNQPKIAILGDSFMEAQRCIEKETTAAILDDLTGIQVLNAGIAGYNNFHHLRVYQEFVKEYRPEVVALFLYVGNDIQYNHCDLAGIVNNFLPCGRLASGAVSLDEITESKLLDRGAFVKPAFWEKFYVGQVWKFAWGRVKRKLGGAAQEQRNAFQIKEYEILNSAAEETWDEAWTVTEKVLVDIKDEVTSNGGKFVIVPIPTQLMLRDDWQAELQTILPQTDLTTYDRDLPLKRLQELCYRQGIDFINLTASFKTYLNQHEMGWPYFSWSCDAHWNPLGHYLAANELATYVYQNQWLGTDSVLLAALRRNINSSPKEILGAEAYEKIYNGGTITNGTEISQRSFQGKN